jgi:cell division protease FtsH
LKAKLVAFLLGTAILLTLLATLGQEGGTRSISYSEFKQLVRAGRVAEVVIGQHRIHGVLKDPPGRFTATRVDDPGLIEVLEQRGVKMTGEVPAAWWTAIAGWVIPLLFPLAFWNLLLKRMGPREGALAFGRSRANLRRRRCQGELR